MSIRVEHYERAILPHVESLIHLTRYMKHLNRNGASVRRRQRLGRRMERIWLEIRRLEALCRIYAGPIRSHALERKWEKYLPAIANYEQ